MSLVPFVHVDLPLAERRAGTDLELPARDRHHLGTVLRLRPGAEVVLADGRGGTAPARLTDAGATLTEAAVTTPPPRPRLTVAQALAKGRKLDDVVRAVTELGADRFQPVAAERSVSRLAADKADKARERWAAVGRAAAEQARRPWRPEVELPVPTGQLHDEVVLVAHPGGASLPAVLEALPPTGAVTLAVGPEGGWTPAEVDRLLAGGARSVGLGPTVLRTEHAAAAALAVVAAFLGRWDAAPGAGWAYGDQP